MALEQVFLATPIPAAGGRVIVSPFQFAVTGEDHLRMEAWNASTGAILEVSYRFAEPNGVIVPHRRTLALTADRIVNEAVISLSPGYLVNLVVLVTGASPLIGQTFVCIKLQRGLGAAAITLGLLVQGYVTHEQGLGWPGSPIEDSFRVGGVCRIITGTDLPNNEILEMVPTGARWNLLALAVDLTTSAVVGTRRTSLTFDDGATRYFRTTNPGSLSASLTATFYWSQGLPLDTVIGGQSATGGIPVDLWLLPGHRIRTMSSGTDAGDDYSAPIYIVREVLEAD